MKANNLVTLALKEIGVTEYPPDSNKVKYNTWYYNKEVTGSAYPWCATFVSWLFKDTDLCKKTASCADMLAWFEKRGQIVKVPQVGDIVFFKYSTNSRRTNHVGIVKAVNGNKITTIEGNTSGSAVGSQDNGGMVCERVRNNNIVAYARPLYDDAWVTVKIGDKGEFVRKLQHLLNKKMQCHLVEDGDAGQLTKIELLKAQGILGLEKDAVAGAKTWSKLLG